MGVALGNVGVRRYLYREKARTLWVTSEFWHTPFTDLRFFSPWTDLLERLFFFFFANTILGWYVAKLTKFV